MSIQVNLKEEHNMNSKRIFATIALSTLLLTGCSFTPKGTIIKVNSENIKQSQFDEVFDKAVSSSMFAQMGVDIKKDKNSFLYLMVKEKVVNELIVKALIDQEIEKRKIKITQEDMDNELKSIIDKVGSKEKFNEILRQNGITPDQFKKDLTDEVKVKKLVSLLETKKITDQDALKFYKENLNKFRYDDKVRASHILIAANPEEIKQKIVSDPANKGLTKDAIQKMINEEMKSKLDQAKKILVDVKKDPSSFAKIAKEVSEDPISAKQGGDLGFFTKQEMVEPFSKVAFSQKPNTISNIVQTPYGYHIILVKDRMAAGQEPFEKVKSEIVSYLENQAQVTVLETLVESLKKQAKIEYINPEYDPAKIQEALKNQAKNDPNAQAEMNPASQSATPSPAPAQAPAPAPAPAN